MPAQAVFNAIIQRFQAAGEKTGWTYILIPEKEVLKMHSADRKGFRVKGFLENVPIDKTSVMPMGGGEMILAINAGMRKALALPIGATIKVRLSKDETVIAIAPDLLTCLADDPKALAFFESLSPSHQKYFSKWVEDAKTETTRTRRLAQAVEGLSRKMDYGTMLRWTRDERSK
ncbi:MAG TPA: YdeI/OmpD-associated family protein [Phnomibacter sp.]|nr:YdeI/OmpD-associated family protein [Phnomibacter sp.]